MIRVIVRLRQADGTEVAVPAQDLRQDPLLPDNLVIVGVAVPVEVEIPGFQVAQWSVRRATGGGPGVTGYTVGAVVEDDGTGEESDTGEENEREEGASELRVLEGSGG